MQYQVFVDAMRSPDNFLTNFFAEKINKGKLKNSNKLRFL